MENPARFGGDGVIKPNPVTSLDQPGDAAKVDNLFSILFLQAQGKELNYIEFTGVGELPAAEDIHELQLTIVHNSTDGVFRLYTKIRGNLKFLNWL